MVVLHEAVPGTARYPVEGQKLFGIVSDLGVPFGYERSVKAATGRLLEARFLLSLHKNALGADPGGLLARTSRALGMPESLRGALFAALPKADIVHFGYEADADGAVYKLYLEFAARLRRHLAQPGRTPRLVHLAAKWRPDRPARATSARYVCRPGLASDDICARLADYYPATAETVPLRVARRLVAIAARRSGGEPPLFMDVRETGNPRRSYDINLYDGDLVLRQVAPLLTETWRHFGLVDADLARLLDDCGSKALGHVSGGMGRDGEDFMTFYFGVEAR